MIRQDWSKEIHDFYKQARELISVFGIFVIGKFNKISPTIFIHVLDDM